MAGLAGSTSGWVAEGACAESAGAFSVPGASTSAVLLPKMDLLFKVVEVAPSGDRIIATADNLAVARAAFNTAVSLWLGSVARPSR